MHGAPSVSHPVGRSRLAAAFIACTWLAAAAGLLFWMSQVQAAPARVVGAACVLVAAGAAAWRGWFLSPQGILAWDGGEWRWTSGAAGEAGTPGAVLDLQHLVLLRWRSAGGAARWLWAERRAQPASWDDLRRAVYSRAPKT